MKARILSIDSAEHRAAQELMPWFVTGTLGADEASSVAKHIAACARCQKDAAEQNELRALAFAAESGDVDRDWAVLRSRIGAVPRFPKRAPDISKPRWWKQWLPITVAVQAAVMLSLVLVLVGGPLRDQRYRALGSAPAAVEPSAVAVFRGDATNQQMRDALHAAGASIVGGPTVTNAYLLRFNTSVGPEGLARLRAQPGVVSVEALQGDSPR